MCISMFVLYVKGPYTLDYALKPVVKYIFTYERIYHINV